MRKSILGTDRNDRILLGDDSHEIHALSGNNSLKVGDGDNRITAADGNNRISAGDGANEIETGSGRNRVTAGDGANTVATGQGHDSITLGDGDNQVTSEAGNNRITLGDGNNHIETGDGNDRIFAGEGLNVIRAGGGRNTITATGDTDIVTGDQNDRIKLGNGDHVVAAGNGRNSIQTGDGTVAFTSGTGNDKITVGDGSGTISAGGGNNRISTGEGVFQIETGAGNDQFKLAGGAATVSTTGGNNRLKGGDGNYTISTGDGRDSIRLGSGTSVIDAGNGRNKIVVKDGNTDITSGGDDDAITVGNGSSRIAAGGGNNRIKGGDGNHRITTGDGNDNIRFGTGDVFIDAGDGRNKILIGDGDHVIRTGLDNDQLRFGLGEIRLTDAGGNNKIVGAGGSVQITAGAGNNNIRLGDGQFEISLGNGNQTVRIGDANSTLLLGDGRHAIHAGDGVTNISAGYGDHKLSLGDGASEVHIAGGSTTIRKADGLFQFEQSAGTTRLTAGNGDETRTSTIQTAEGNDQIKLGSGAFHVTSGAGNDRIQSRGGDSYFDAGAGNDQIRAGTGNDSILGGAGNDKIDGGKGSDTAVYSGSFLDYYIEAFNRSTIQVTSTTGDVTDAGTDQLRGIEYIYFEGDGSTLDVHDISVLASLYTLDLENDVIRMVPTSPYEFSVSALLENDTAHGVTAEDVTVSGISSEGVAIEFDGVNITYNSEDVLQHLAAGEIFYDCFSYSVTNAWGASDTAVVHISVLGNGNGPQAEDDLLSGAEHDFDPTGGSQLTISDAARSEYHSSTISYGDGGYITVWQEGAHAIRAMINNSAGSIGPIEIASHGGSVDRVGMPTVTELENGKFAVIWQTLTMDYSDEAGIYNGEMYQLIGRIFNADGSPSGPEFDVSDSTGLVWPATTTLSNGNFVTVWLQYDDTEEEYSYPYTDTAVYFKIFNAAGETVVEETMIFDTAEYSSIGYLFPPQIEALPDGGFAISWNDTEFVPQAETHSVHTAVYDNQGQEVVEPFRVSEGGAEIVSWLSDMSVDEDGNILIVWEGDADRYMRPDLADITYGTILDPNGNVLVEAFEIENAVDAGGWRSDNQVTAFLPNGQFVITWQGTHIASSGPDAGQEVTGLFAQITNRDGSAATDPVHVYSGDRDARTTSIAVLENDSFVITWNGDGDIYGRVFDFDGSPVEDYYLLEDEVAEIDLQALLANDDLEENNSFVFNLDSATSENGASLSFDEDSGLIFYDPTAATNLQALAEGEVLEDTFTYTIEDEFGRSDQATVTILVGGLDEVIG